MVVFGSALWLCFGPGLLIGAGCAGDPCAGEGFPEGQAQLLRSQTVDLCVCCLEALAAENSKPLQCWNSQSRAHILW